MSDEGDAPNVIQALRRVMRDLPGIGKSSKNVQQGYSFRGIEIVTAELQPLLARHGVVFTPRVVSWEEREIVVNSKPWTDQRLLVEYDVYGPGGVSDKITVGPVPGIGRDNSDKGSNKAMSQAFKYAVVQALSIGDKKDDADADVAHERDAAPPPRTRKTPARNEPPPNVDERGEVHGPTMTDAQNRSLRALYGKLGIKGPAEQKRVSAIVLGVEPFETHSALAVDVVSQLIKRLTAVEAGFLEFVLDDQANVIGVRDAVPPTEQGDHE